MLAHKIDREGPPYSRMITYSESPYICIASKVSETQSRRPRQAFYENRFMGKQRTKPLFVTMSKDMVKRREQRLSPPGVNWRGAGYPTYHGGGIQQVQHTRTSRFTMLSDWLMNIDSLRNGTRNQPTPSREVLDQFRYVGAYYDGLLRALDTARLSITQGWAGPHLRLKEFADFHWTDKRFAFVVALPNSMDENMFLDIVRDQTETDIVEPYGKRQWLIVGRFE
jgi:hypothetical protein